MAKKQRENKRINTNNKIDESEEQEDEELENQKMEMFFNLIKNYQEAKKRRRTELTGDSIPVPATKRSNDGGEKSGGIVPVFRAEDFFHCTDLNLNLTPSNSIVLTKNQEPDQEEEDEEEETEEKEIREEHNNGLDLNLNLAL